MYFLVIIQSTYCSYVLGQFGQKSTYNLKRHICFNKTSKATMKACFKIYRVLVYPLNV